MCSKTFFMNELDSCWPHNRPHRTHAEQEPPVDALYLMVDDLNDIRLTFPRAVDLVDELMQNQAGLFREGVSAFCGEVPVELTPGHISDEHIWNALKARMSQEIKCRYPH
jgi:hypothetical protein